MILEQYRVVQWSQSAYEPAFYEASFPTNQGASPMRPPENFLKECRECIAIGYVPTGSMGMTVVEVDNGTFLCYQQSFYHPNWTDDVVLANTYQVMIASDWVKSGDSNADYLQRIEHESRLQELINQIRDITNLTYYQCENIVLSQGTVKSHLSRAEADDIAEMIEAAGGKVHIYNMLGELVSGENRL
jgi:hypothetical protein